ncbi:MAG: hypothetical protein ACLFTE_09355, partial [Salinivenus sp.]
MQGHAVPDNRQDAGAVVVVSAQASPSPVEDVLSALRLKSRDPVALGLYTVVGLSLLVGYLHWRVVVANRGRMFLKQVLSNRAAEVRRQNRQLEAYNREL